MDIETMFELQHKQTVNGDHVGSKLKQKDR